MIVVSNATPLIALAKINHLHLLQRFFVTVLIPQAVHEEVVRAGVGRPGSREVRQADWIQLRTVSDETRVAYLRAELDPGEAEVLVLGEEVSADLLLVDEPKARLAAGLLDLRCVGAIGLVSGQTKR